VLICGGGNNWGTVYTAAHKVGKTVVGGEDATVGIGGLVLNGGHGLLSSSHGLASDSVYQVKVVTPDGRIIVANDVQNQDLFWAVRGAGGGQFGVVTEFVLQTHPVPKNVVTGGLTFYPRSKSTISKDASWFAFAEVASSLPDLMDQGITGTLMAVTGETAVSYLGLSEALPGASVMLSFLVYNSTVQNMNGTLQELAANITRASHNQVNLTLTSPEAQSYWSYTKPDFSASQSAGATSLLSSRLLGRNELCNLPRSDLVSYLQQISAAQVPESGTLLVWGLQGGKGPASTTDIRRGSVLPAWRTAYAHVMSYGGTVNATADPSEALAVGAKWYETVMEPVWRVWAPHTGSYMNEGNPFSSTWKHDFYGKNYRRLQGVKQKYDPSESIFVWSGIGSDHWQYDLQSGLLCRVHPQ
jgi:FAD/FMN-containing dehydrogenase